VVCAPPSGSFFPAGTTSVLCTATDDCGNASSCSFDVTVTGSNTVAVDVELVGVSVPVSRCVRFVTNACGADTEVSLSFVDHDALPGTPVRASALIEVPCGTYISLCGKDRQHTTWSMVGLVLSGTIWQATSVMSLEAGDTDDDGDVDIHDITWFMAQFGGVAAAGGCPWDGITRDSDFSNNGVIAAEDYSFLVDRWLTTSACACALTWLPGGPLARPAISAEVGNALQAKADLNRDGRVDHRDVELFELQHGFSGELSRRMRASR
jgi:hypothetical protein